MKTKLAIVVSHPIQHFVHLYRALAAEPSIELKVFFCSKIGLKPYFDVDMNQQITWAMDLLSGYDHEFLPEADRIDKTSWKLNNPSVGAALSKFAPDVLLVYGYSQITQLRALAWARMKGVPVLMKSDTNAVEHRHPAQAFVRSLVLRRLLRQVSGFITVGDQNETMLASLDVPRGKMYRTPFPIDETVYREYATRRSEMRSELRNRFQIADGFVIGLYVGKLSVRKRGIDVVEALTRVAEPTAARLHIIFCGNGSEMDVLEARIRETGVNASLAGFVNVDALPSYYAGSDFLVHPSGKDPHPLVGSEASAVGLPLVLSDRVGLIGPTDIARPGVNTLVFPCGDVDALAAAMSRLVDDDALRARMSQSSLDIFEECDLKASVAGMLRAVESVLPNQTGEQLRQA